MKPTNDLEKAIGSFRLKTSDSLDERIAAGILADSAQPAGQTPSKPFLIRLGKTMIHTRWTRYATAATIVIGVAVALMVINTSASLTLADVQEAVAGQSWVHVRYDNGREEWTNLRDGRNFLRDVGGTLEGHTVLLDRAAGIRMSYWPTSGQFIARDRIEPWSTPRNAWELVMGTPQEQSQLGGAPDLVEEIVDGKPLVRLDIFTIDALGKRIVIEQVWADPKTRLPLQVKRKLDLAGRHAQNREYITARYEFPATGPSSLEDLGVPRNLPVVDRQPTPQDAQQIIEAGKAARERFPKHYRVIRYEPESPADIRVFWRDGERFRLDSYMNIQPYGKDYEQKGYAKYHLDLPAMAEQILAWAKQQQDVGNTYIYANGKSYSRHNPHPVIVNAPKGPQARVMNESPGRDEPMLVNSPNWPHNQPWPYVNTGSGWQVLPASEDLPASCVGLRYEVGDVRRDCIIDPAHDYICVNYIWWKQKDGQWIKDRQDQLLDLQQLPTGQWYPRQWKIVGWTLENPPRPYETIHQDDFHLLDGSEVPADLFDGQKLLQGAHVETY